jgi:hypothetical protein
LPTQTQPNQTMAMSISGVDNPGWLHLHRTMLWP